MNLIIACLFKGHKFVNDKAICERCGKNLCSINGHEWIHSDETTYTFIKIHRHTCFEYRECKICKIKMKNHPVMIDYTYGGNDFRDHWTRIK